MYTVYTINVVGLHSNSTIAIEPKSAGYPLCLQYATIIIYNILLKFSATLQQCNLHVRLHMFGGI